MCVVVHDKEGGAGGQYTGANLMVEALSVAGVGGLALLGCSYSVMLSREVTRKCFDKSRDTATTLHNMSATIRFPHHARTVWTCCRGLSSFHHFTKDETPIESCFILCLPPLSTKSSVWDGTTRCVCV